MGDSDPPPPLSQTIEASPLAQTIGRNDSTTRLAIPDMPTPLIQPVPAAVAEPPDGQPQRIGRYLIHRMLGAGGMGVVYAGYDEELDRKVAIKLLHPAQQGDSQLRARIIREAQSLARVSAPNVVHVYEVGEFAGQLFIVMELVNGTTLTRWQAEPGRNWKEILRMYCAAGQGLLDAHAAALVHRDFKPDNVLLGQDGRPRVADFGLARMQSPGRGRGNNAVTAVYQTVQVPDPTKPIPAALTQVGMVIGTPLYMSPEQHLGDPADARSDQFSFCVALYEALYHRLPFPGATVRELAISTLKGRVLPPPADSTVPTPVHDALLRGLARAPDRRFPSMRELLATLSFDPARDPATAPQQRRWVAVSVPAVVSASVVGLLLLRLLGVSAMTSSFVISVALFAFCTVIPLRFRRALTTNSFHRGVMVTGVAFTGQMVCLRLVGMAVHLSISQVMTIDLVNLFWMTAIVAATFLPRMWPVLPLSALGALISAAWPASAQVISSVVIPIGIVASIVAWNQEVRSLVRTRRDKAQRPAS